MALRRQGLSQRRKAVGFTQESLAEHLGVERSTVVRWEAGDTEPLPSIRPKVARALHVSIDELTELLTESENADTTRTPSTDTEVTSPVLLPEVRSSRCGSEDLIRLQLAETVEALRSAGVAPEDLGAMLLAAITLDVEPAGVPRRRARSQRFNRFALVGAVALAFAGGAASGLFITSHSSPIPPAAAGILAPATTVVATPAPQPGSSNDKSSRGKDTTGTVHTAPVTAPNTSADGPASPSAAATPAPHTIRNGNQTTTPAVTTAPALPHTPAIPAEAYRWSQAAALSASEQRMTRLIPGALPRP